MKLYLNDGDTNATETEYSHSRSRLNLGSVESSTVTCKERKVRQMLKYIFGRSCSTCGNATAEKADLLERRFSGDLGHSDLRHHSVLAEGRAAHVVVDCLTLAGEARGTIRHKTLTLYSPCNNGVRL